MKFSINNIRKPKKQQLQLQKQQIQKMNLINCLIVLILTTFTFATAPPIDIVFIIQRSQDTKYQSELSQNLKENLIKQSVELQPKYRINVHLLHEIFNYPGGWTIHNLIPQLMLLQRNRHLNTNMKYTNTNTNTHTDTDTNRNTNKQIDGKVINENTRWIVFCEEGTRVNVKLLMERLNNENHTQPLYLGHPLYDREPTIIHHFAFFENPKWFPYPMLRAGVVFSMPLFKSIVDIYINHNNNNKHLKQQSSILQRSEFSIDASHELARFIYDNVQIKTEISENNKIKNKIPDINMKRKSPTTNEPSPSPSPRITTSSHRDTNKNDMTSTYTNVSVLSHSDFRTTTTNEIIDKHKDNISNITTKTTTTSVTNNSNNKNYNIKRQKIILKKASYICPTATWETGSTMNNKNNNNNKKSNYINSSSSSSDTNKNNNDNKACAMYAATAAEQTTNAASSMTCNPVKREEIYFAVKTCTKYHNERLPIIQTTWAQYAKHIKYFSDFQDDTKSTINTGIPNVEMGHCAKTLQILKLALRDIENYNNNNNDKNNKDNNKNNNKNRHERNQGKHENHQIQWLFLTDDDTLLSISGVCQVLGCYNSMDEIYLGERYGYRLYAQDGFNYITGGGGIAFSLPVVKLILQHCSCPSPSSPDDMILGSCLHSLQLKALHSSRFHQARPSDYPLELLKLEPPISFHKFWQHDPIEVYNRWFAAADQELLAEEKLLQENLIELNYRSKTRKLLARTEPLNLNELPVSLVASLHHSKERHVDL
ncbi:beta-1,3-glucosyltransferase isoform 1-T5 [Cochliomyia hominivorax]